MTEMDYLISESQWVKKARRSIDIMFYCLICFTIIFFFEKSEWIIFRNISAVFHFLFSLYIVIKMYFFHDRYALFNYRLNVCFSDVPLEKQVAASRLYGWKDAMETMLSATECHQSHISGDCPLCGAN